MKPSTPRSARITRLSSSTIAYRANHDHERQTIFDDAVAWKRLLDEKVFSDQNTLAEKIGKDKASISKTLSLNALPNTLLERMASANDVVGLQAAYFLKLIFERLGEPTADRLLTAVIDRKSRFVIWRISCVRKATAARKRDVRVTAFAMTSRSNRERSAS